MAGANYNGISALLRIAKAGEKPDPFAIEVLAYHGAIESEIERVIAGLVSRPEGLCGTCQRL